MRPFGDYRASPIEEVTVGVNASDEFGLHDVQLHYSVNGGAEQSVKVLKAPGAKDSQGQYTLQLENYKLVPGDLVSIYATAKDGNSEWRTQISLFRRIRLSASSRSRSRAVAAAVVEAADRATRPTSRGGRRS